MVNWQRWDISVVVNTSDCRSDTMGSIPICPAKDKNMIIGNVVGIVIGFYIMFEMWRNRNKE